MIDRFHVCLANIWNKKIISPMPSLKYCIVTFNDWLDLYTIHYSLPNVVYSENIAKSCDTKRWSFLHECWWKNLSIFTPYLDFALTLISTIAFKKYILYKNVFLCHIKCIRCIIIECFFPLWQQLLNQCAWYQTRWWRRWSEWWWTQSPGWWLRWWWWWRWRRQSPGWCCSRSLRLHGCPRHWCWSWQSERIGVQLQAEKDNWWQSADIKVEIRWLVSTEE